MAAAWQNLEDREGHPVSLERARALAGAGDKQLSPSSLSSYRRGRELPGRKNLEFLANLFHPGDSKEQHEFKVSVRAAWQPRLATSLIDPLDILVAKERSLSVGVINYGPYAWNDDMPGRGFFDMFFKMFVGYAALGGTEGSDFRRVGFDDVPRELCWDGSIDVALAILATPDRARQMKFFPTPITSHVNAVVRQDDMAKHGEIINALVDPFGQSGTGHVKLRPIVNELEVGGLYVRNYLRRQPATYESVPYEISNYADKVVEPRSGSSLIRVLVADEVTCLLVKEECERQGELAELVFRRTKDEAAASTHFLPRYRLAFAVNRNHPKWVDYLTDAFAYFVEANAQVMARLYRQLEDQLLARLGGDRKKEGWRIKEWLGIEPRASLVPGDPWESVLTAYHKLDLDKGVVKLCSRKR